jgi:AcrR family transcriptional regulator
VNARLIERGLSNTKLVVVDGGDAGDFSDDRVVERPDPPLPAGAVQDHRLGGARLAGERSGRDLEHRRRDRERDVRTEWVAAEPSHGKPAAEVDGGEVAPVYPLDRVPSADVPAEHVDEVGVRLVPLGVAADVARVPLRHQAIEQPVDGRFVERGYANTPVRLLAGTAGVALQTVYATYGSKAGVLAALPDLVDEEAGIIDLVEAARDTTDPAELLRLLARISRRVQERCGDLLKVLASADTDPDVAAATAEAARRHRIGTRAILSRIRRTGGLAAGLTLTRATDVVVALTGSEVCDNLVRRAGWTYDEYEDWLAASLVTLLLPAPSGRRGRDPRAAGRGTPLSQA